MPEKIKISVNGQEVKVSFDLQEVVIDTNLYLPAMFSILLRDESDATTGKLTYTDSDETFKLGAEVKIEIETDEIPGEANLVKATLIIGEITAIEPAFTANNQQLLQVRGYDRAHRLSRGKKSRTYGDANPNGSGVTEKNIIDTIVGETEGVTGAKVDMADISKLKYPYVIQANQTDLEFLWSRAEMVGYQVYVEDKTLYFQKADAHRGEASQKPGVLRWPTSLRSFHPRLTLSHQVDKAVVTGWDPKTKQQVKGEISSDKSKTVPKVGIKQVGGQAAKSALKGTAEMVVVTQPGMSIDQAKSIAQAQFSAAQSEFIQAEGALRFGDPRVIAGRIVTIEGVGTKFSGDYYVTEARHVFMYSQYRVTFSVTGRNPYTARQLLSQSGGGGGQHGGSSGQMSGVVAAKVTSLEDPEQLGRVQVMFPWLPKHKGADLASNWARVASPMAGKERGFMFLPEIDDEVLVAFEQGNANSPYIIGGLWNNKDKPPQGTADVLASDKKTVNQRVIRSRTGHLIILDDTEGKEQIIIQDKTEKNKIVVDSKTNSMTINVDKDLTIEAKGKIVLKSTDDFSIDCKNLNIKAKMAGKVETSTQLGLKGGSAGTTIEGGTGAKIALSGPSVNINNGALEVM